MARKTRAELAALQDDLIDALEDLPEVYLECRDPGLRHQWKRSQNYHVIQAVWSGRKQPLIARDSECMRCGTHKRERFVITKGDLLEKVANLYTYPEHYNLQGFPRGLKRSSAVWTAGYRRAMKEATGKAARELRAV